MHRLTQWSAKRSGPCMTVKGRAVVKRLSDVSVATDDVKLSRVYEIKRDDSGRTFALDGVGNRLAYLD